MTALRNQLHAFRTAHRAACYPGDLSAELLGMTGRLSPWQMVLRYVPSGAVAAAIVIGLYVYRPAGAAVVDGAAALRDSVDSVRRAVQDTGWWPGGQSGGESSSGGAYLSTPELDGLTVPTTPSAPAAPAAPPAAPRTRSPQEAA